MGTQYGNYFSGRGKEGKVAASRHGNFLSIMDATGWSYADALAFYESAPDDMYREFEIRLEQKGQAAMERQKLMEAQQRAMTKGNRRGGRRR